MRTALFAALLCSVALCGCGTACDREAAAIRSANDKGAPCGVGASSFDDNKCNDGLHSCSQDDQVAINNFSSCLEGLPACTNDTKTSWGLSRLGCVTDLGKASLTCINATQ